MEHFLLKKNCFGSNDKILVLFVFLCLLWIGNTVFVQGAAATPIHMVNAMAEYGKSKQLKGVTVIHMHTEGPAAYCDPSCEGVFRY